MLVGFGRQKGNEMNDKGNVAKATADLRTIALREFPHLDGQQSVNVHEMLEILHTVDVHRQLVENARADQRNMWRLIMLVQTIGMWFVVTLVAAIYLPGMVKFSPLVPLAFDLAVTAWNKHRKV